MHWIVFNIKNEYEFTFHIRPWHVVTLCRPLNFTLRNSATFRSDTIHRICLNLDIHLLPLKRFIHQIIYLDCAWIFWNVYLTHWGKVTHIYVGKLTIIGSDNGLSPDRRQAIIWTNAGILLIGPLGINFNEILIGIQTFSFKKIHLRMSSGKWRPFCLGLDVLNTTKNCIKNHLS